MPLICLIIRLDMAKERVSEIKGNPIESFQTEIWKKKQKKQKQVIQECDIISKDVICTNLECKRKRNNRGKEIFEIFN